MRCFRLILPLFISISTGRALGEDGFVPLFNGHNLSGWVNVNCAPETWSVRNGVICCTGQPNGALRTERQFENFILEVQWRHLACAGNSGIFIWGTPVAAPGVPFLRGIEAQILDHGFADNYEKQNGKTSRWFTVHGDVFPIHGATMIPFGRHEGERSFPSENRSNRSPEWNQYRIICTNGVVRLHVNGKEVSGGENCNYRKGYLGLESEGSPVEFRNLKIKELPASGAPVELTAPVDVGFRPILTGLDFRGWKTNAATVLRWQVGENRLKLKAGTQNTNSDAILWTEKEYGDAEFIIDCRVAKPEIGKDFSVPTILLRSLSSEIKLTGASPGPYRRYVITVVGQEVILKQNENEIQRITLPGGIPERGAFGLRDTGSAIEYMNLYVRDL